MRSSYPFDPDDWATITPLYVALSEALLSHVGFMEWLTRWNELDIAVYDAWTHLKRRAYYDTSDLAAERAYQLFTQEVFSTARQYTTAARVVSRRRHSIPVHASGG
ncbi:MAG TPA: hypothetical protein VER55_14415 [Ardenticatenaceae bacterium]|nr:hypothetical protein [Ardenticatenaceae bacterium]